MKAVRCNHGKVFVADVPAPSGEGVNVKIASAGICGSDLHMLASGWPLPNTLGHELAGTTPIHRVTRTTGDEAWVPEGAVLTARLRTGWADRGVAFHASLALLGAPPLEVRQTLFEVRHRIVPLEDARLDAAFDDLQRLLDGLIL